jgi:hypothetical protein
MRQLDAVLSFLAQQRLQEGVVRLSALVADGASLEAEVAFSRSDATLALRHPRLGELTLTPTRVEHRSAAGAVLGSAADCAAALDTLRSGLRPSLSWIHGALDAVSVRDRRLRAVLSDFAGVQNQFTAIVIPGIAAFGAPWGPLTIGPVSFPRSKAHVMLSNLAVDVATGFLGFRMSVLGGRGEGPLRIALGDHDAAAPDSAPFVTIHDPSFDVEADVVLGVRLTGGPAVTSADVRVSSASITGAAGEASFPGVDAGSPVTASLASPSLSIADLSASVDALASPAAVEVAGGPVRLFCAEATAAKEGGWDLADDTRLAPAAGGSTALGARATGLSLEVFAGRALRGELSVAELELDRVDAHVKRTALAGAAGTLGASATFGPGYAEARLAGDLRLDEIGLAWETDDGGGARESSFGLRDVSAGASGRVRLVAGPGGATRSDVRFDAVRLSAESGGLSTWLRPVEAEPPVEVAVALGPIRIAVQDVALAPALGAVRVAASIESVATPVPIGRLALPLPGSDTPVVLEAVALAVEGARFDGALSPDGDAASLEGTLRLDRTRFRAGAVRGLRYPPYLASPVDLHPVAAGEEYEVVDLLVALPKGRVVASSAGIQQRFDAISVDLGSFRLDVPDRDDNRLRLEIASQPPVRAATSLLLALPEATLVVASHPGNPVALTNVGVALAREVHGAELPDHLRVLRSQVLLRFSLEGLVLTVFHIPISDEWRSVTVLDGVEALAGVLKALFDKVGLGGLIDVVEKIVSIAADAAPFLSALLGLGGLLFSIDDVGPAIKLHPVDIEIDEERSSASRIAIALTGGIKDLGVVVEWSHPGWPPWEREHHRDHIGTGLDVKLTLVMEFGFRLDLARRRIEVTDVEFFLKPEGSGVFQRILEEAQKALLDMVFDAVDVRERIIEAINERINFEIPADWNISMARVRFMVNEADPRLTKFAAEVEATISDWSSI